VPYYFDHFFFRCVRRDLFLCHNTSVISFLHQLTTWHCLYSATAAAQLLLSGAPAVQQSIDIFHLPSRQGKVCHASWGVLVGCSSPFLRQWARMWINHWSLWCMASATTDLWLPSKVLDITATWPVPNYTTWWQRHLCANNLPKVVTWKRNGRDLNLRRFCELWVRHPNHYTTRPQSRAHSSKPTAAACSGQMKQTDRRTHGSYIDLALHTMRTVPIMCLLVSCFSYVDLIYACFCSATACVDDNVWVQMLGVIRSTETAGHWPTVEAALFVMSSVARHVDVWVDYVKLLTGLLALRLPHVLCD